MLKTVPIIAKVFLFFLLTIRAIIPSMAPIIPKKNDTLLIIGTHENNKAIPPKMIANIPKTFFSDINNLLLAFNVSPIYTCVGRVNLYL